MKTCSVCKLEKGFDFYHKSSHLKNFAIDHCHTTGQIRGLLCNPCNRGLGFLRDDPSLLRVAATYLETH